MKTKKWNKLGKFVMIILSSILLITTWNESVKAEKVATSQTFKRVDPYQAVHQMGAGWNLGNTLDAIPTEGSWSPPVTSETFDYIKEAGFKSVRIPVTWTHHMGDAPDYAVDPDWMNRVEEVVDMALERGFYVVLNVHHDSWEWADLSDNENLEEKHRRLQLLWGQIADHFKLKSEKLMFETLNEPAGSTEEAAQQYNIMNKNLLNVIRSSGGYNNERLVILPGINTNIERTIEWFENPDPNDKNLILTVHNYDPWNFVSRYWGTTQWNNRDYFDQLFGQLDAFSDRIGAPVIIGEYGTLALGTVEKHSKWIYTDSFVRAAHKYGMATMVWDIGIDLFDRENKTWIDPITRDIILNASKGIPNSFVEQASLYFEEDEEITDHPLQLELNGNRLTGVYNGNMKLKKGKDYTLQGSVVTLKGSYLSSHVHNLGLEATLRFRFSRGADQMLDIIKYKAPELATTEVTINRGEVTEDLKIPAVFNGTDLATVTALEMNTIDNQTGTPLPMPVKDEWTNTMPNTPSGGLRGGLNYNDDFWSDSDYVYISKNVLNQMDDDAIFSFKFWPMDKEININVIVRLQ